MAGGRLQGKSVIITGAAAGIGRGTAELFAEEGARLVLVDQNAQGLKEYAASVEARGFEVRAIWGDVSDAAVIQEAVEMAKGSFGGVDVVFNNAGIMPTGDLVGFSVENFDRVMAVNVRSMFLMCKAAIPEMRRRGGGAIVNTSSVMAMLTEPGYTAYTASKAAIIGLTKEIAVSYAEEGIRCNAVCPGWVDTDLNRRLAEELGGMDKLYPIIRRQQPLGRMATAREVAYAVLFLSSDEASAVTGSCLYVDGAASAAI